MIPFLPYFDFHSARRSGLADVFGSSELRLAGRSRELIALIADVMQLGQGHEVLIPASICPDAIIPFVARGVTLRGYPLDGQLRVNTSDLASRINSRTRAVYVVHYFGFRQDIRPVRALCDDANVRLIEDCATCVPTGSDTSGCAEPGDAVFYSLWKILPIPDGAVGFGPLISKAEGPQLNAPISLRLRRAMGLAIRTTFGVQSFADELVAAYKEHRLTREEQDETYTAASSCSARRPSGLTSSLIQYTDWASVQARRRKNYVNLVSLLRDMPCIAPIWDTLPQGTVPFALPVKVQHPDRLQRALLRQGIETERSFGSINRKLISVGGAPSDYADVEGLAKQTLSLPIHQSIQPDGIRRIATVIRRFLYTQPEE